MNWATDDTEIDLLTKLASAANMFSDKVKPDMNGTLLNPITHEEYSCDLVWKQAKVVFLSAENQDLTPVLKDGGWICLCSSAPDLTPNEIIKNIPEV